jgi:hypothetical protein
MKRGINCKGDIPSQALFFLFEILMVMVVLVALLSYVDSIKKNTLFEKNYLARDIALTLNTLGTVPGNIFYLYSNPKVELKNFDIILNNNFAGVKEKEEKSNIVSFPYADNTLFNLKIDPPGSAQNIELLKSGKTFSTRHSSNIGQLNIFYLPEQKDNQKIVFDIQNGIDDETTKKIFDIYGGINSQYSLKPDLIRTARADISIPYSYAETDRILSEFKPYAAVSLNIGSYSKTKNYIKAYYNAESPWKSNITKFASFIINSVSEKLNDHSTIDGTGIIPINTKNINANSQMQILKNDMVVIVLEIGNIQNDNGKKMVAENAGTIGSAIAEGINSYFEYENKKIFNQPQ